MAKLDRSEVLSYKAAKELTTYADSKFSDPRVVEKLVAAGANYDVKLPKYRTIPVSALIAAGLLTEDGKSTKRGYTATGGGYVTAKVSRLTIAEAEKEREQLRRELSDLTTSLTQTETAEVEADRQLANLKAAKADIAKKLVALRKLRSVHESRIQSLDAHIEQRKDAELAETEAKLAELERATAETKALYKRLKAPKELKPKKS